MRHQVSLKDIANKVGVSTTLVSYVLNDKLKNRINKQTAAKIKKAAKEMGYQTNQIAKSLKNSKTQTIGLIVADISNPFSASIARIIEDEAKKNNYTLLFGSADEDCDKAADLINLLLNRQVDGFIIAAPDGFEDYLISLKEKQVPFVLIDRYYPNQAFNYIATNNFQASYQAVKHLIDSGFKNIGMLNYKIKLFHMNERMRGYKEAIRDSGLKMKKTNIVKLNEKTMAEDMESSMNKLIKTDQPIDAIFFSSNNIAIEGLKYLSRNNIRIPEELGVVCFDYTSAYDLFNTTITHINQPLKQMGEQAVHYILKLINNEQILVANELESELVIQNSSIG